MNSEITCRVCHVVNKGFLKQRNVERERKFDRLAPRVVDKPALTQLLQGEYQVAGSPVLLTAIQRFSQQ